MAELHPTTPHEQMEKLDRAGTPYTISYSLATDTGPVLQMRTANVLGHSKRWLCLTRRGVSEFWVAMAAIARLEIQEL